MNKVELTALRRLAEEATPGPWELHVSGLIRRCFDDIAAPIAEMRTPYRHGVGIVKGEHEQWNNANLIAAANPSTILQLLDYIETLEKDAARYRWLRDTCMDDPKTRLAVMNGFIDYETVDYVYGEGMDATIDAAMQGETE